MSELRAISFENGKVVVVIDKKGSMGDYEATTEAIKAIRGDP